MPRRVDIQITIFISYFGSKASQVNSSDFSTAYKILKADLLVLKVCYPKRENVEVTPGCVKFFWTTRINSPLHKAVIQRTRPAESERTAHERTLHDLSITEMIVQETAISNSPSKPLIPPTQKGSYPYLQPQLQYRNPIPSRQEETSYEVKHQNIPSESTSVYINTPLRYSSSDSIVIANINDETQRLLNQLDESFRSRGFKAEPIENILIPEPMQAESVATSFRMSPPPPPQKPLLLFPTLAQTEGSTTNFPPYSNQTHVASQVNQSDSRSPHPSSGDSRSSEATPAATFVPIRPPMPLAVPPLNPAEISRLTRELWDVRRQITANLARETSILKNLQQLNAPNIPELSQSNSNNDFVMKARLQMVERELQTERKKRMEAEETLKDVERECREPFVVPALLEAFVSISKLTTQSLDPGNQWGVG